MKSNSIWKKVLLFTIGSVFALHVQVVSAQDDTSTVKTSTTNTSGEECVITDDQG